MIEQQEKLQKKLDALVEEEAVEGCGLVSRDGIPVLSSFSPAFDQRVFSILVEGAMIATLMGAAEEAMGELDAGEVNHVTVDTDTLRLIAVGATEDLVLLAITEPNADLDETLDPVLDALDAISGHL